MSKPMTKAALEEMATNAVAAQLAAQAATDEARTELDAAYRNLDEAQHLISALQERLFAVEMEAVTYRAEQIAAAPAGPGPVDPGHEHAAEED